VVSPGGYQECGLAGELLEFANFEGERPFDILVEDDIMYLTNRNGFVCSLKIK
jgi:hypothetical protein